MWTVPLPEGSHASQGCWSAADGEGVADGETDGEGVADGETDGEVDGEADGVPPADGVGVAVDAGVGVDDTPGDEVAAPTPQPATAAVSSRLASAQRRCWGRPGRARVKARLAKKELDPVGGVSLPRPIAQVVAIS